MKMSSTGRWGLARASALAACLLWLGAHVAMAGFIVQLPPDLDGTDTDGDGLKSNDNVGFHLAAGDGYVKMADGADIYSFGFSDANSVDPKMVMMTNMLAAEFSAPTLIMKEGQRFYLTLSNVGMTVRSDLFDAHTVHFHGFPNAAPIFDGVPDSGPSINMGSSITFFYQLVEPGTFMYHCHFEATEHMQMGMLGNLYVLPKQNTLAEGAKLGAFTHHAGYKYVYNDGDGSTRYDVEFPLQLVGFDPVFHDADETFQPLPFAAMRDTYPMINGRGYPDTIKAAPILNMNGLPSQRVNALVYAVPGQKILLRLSNLGTTDYYTVTALGIPMKVVGVGARLLRGPTGKDLSYNTSSVTLGGGEAADVLLDTTGVAVGRYFIYTNNMEFLANDQQDFGGMMTEIVLVDLKALTPDGSALLPRTTAPKFTYSYTGDTSRQFQIQIAANTENLGSDTQGLTLPVVPVAPLSYTLSTAEFGTLQAFLKARYTGTFAWRVAATDPLDGTMVTSAPISKVSFDLGSITQTAPADKANQSSTKLPRPTMTFTTTGTALTKYQLQISNQDTFPTGKTVTLPSATTFTASKSIAVTAAAWNTVNGWFTGQANPPAWPVYWRIVGTTADNKWSLASSTRVLNITKP